MRSLLVFLLWFLAIFVGFLVLLPIWLVFVTIPRTCWRAYRGEDGMFQPEWEMPWFPMAWTLHSIRRLDPKNKKDTPSL
jgi:hypothetical protein